MQGTAAVAQWIEYWPPKPRVVGSIPASRATGLFGYLSSLTGRVVTSVPSQLPFGSCATWPIRRPKDCCSAVFFLFRVLLHPLRMLSVARLRRSPLDSGLYPFSNDLLLMFCPPPREQKPKPTKFSECKKQDAHISGRLAISWLREQDLNLRPLGYEPNELPGCSIARQEGNYSTLQAAASVVAAASAATGRSTSSTRAMGALSPTRNPIFRMRV